MTGHNEWANRLISLGFVLTVTEGNASSFFPSLWWFHWLCIYLPAFKKVSWGFPNKAPRGKSQFCCSWMEGEFCCLDSLSSLLKMLMLLFSHSVMSSSLWPHGWQHTRLPCPSPSPRACSDSCSLSQWCHPTISSSVALFSCLQSFPASGSFLNSRFFTSGG